MTWWKPKKNLNSIYEASWYIVFKSIRTTLEGEYNHEFNLFSTPNI